MIHDFLGDKTLLRCFWRADSYNWIFPSWYKWLRKFKLDLCCCLKVLCELTSPLFFIVVLKWKCWENKNIIQQFRSHRIEHVLSYQLYWGLRSSIGGIQYHQHYQAFTWVRKYIWFFHQMPLCVYSIKWEKINQTKNHNQLKQQPTKLTNQNKTKKSPALTNQQKSCQKTIVKF